MIKMVPPLAPVPSSAPRPSLSDAFRRLAPQVSTAPAAPPASSVPVEDLDDVDEAPAPRAQRPIPSGWTRIVGPRLAHIVLNFTERMSVYTQVPGKAYEAAELEEETREYCDQAMAQALEAWFPASALTPGKQLIVAFGLAAGEQWAGRREIEPPKKPIAAPPLTPPAAPPVPVHAAATSTPPPPVPVPDELPLTDVA